jgi:hypothetical protein
VTERESGVRGYNWATLSLGNVNTWTWSSRLGFDERLTTLLCKNILLLNKNKLNRMINLAESSKEGYDSKRAVLPMMIMMIRMMVS